MNYKTQTDNMSDSILNSIKVIKQQHCQIPLVDHRRRKEYHEPNPRLWGHFSTVQSKSKSKLIRQLKNNGYYKGLLYVDYFYIKDEAYRFSDAHNRLPMFSIDKCDKQAKKWYTATGYDDWWRFYSKIPPKNRYAYEVVLPELECHFYVDAEVGLEKNEETLEFFEDLFKELIQELKLFMKMWYIAPQKNLDNMKVIILDSSKPTKFSKHTIFKIPECMFKNNYYCGAFIRQFHSYILKKYGPMESNKFYIYCDNQSEFKQFIIDLGVYTKGRDFRLLGSRKRVSNEHRWLWMEGNPNKLERSDFFDSLIQYQSPDETLKYLISNVPDTLNNGVPISSSLRTLSPKGTDGGSVITANVKGGVISSYGYNVVSIGGNSLKRRKIIHPSDELIEKMCEWILNKYNIQVTKVSIKNSVMIFNTLSRRCLIKKYIIGCSKNKNNAEDWLHSKNMIFLIIDPKRASIRQSCFNQTYCVDPRTQKHRKYNLGYIDDTEILKILRQFCKDNDWNFRYPYQQSNEWIGYESDESESE